MPEIRTLNYTEDHIQQALTRDGRPDLQRLVGFPAVFAEETNGDPQQVARVGRIISARLVGREIQLEYSYDPLITPIRQSDLERLSGSLDIRVANRGIGELNNTHWAVKDADLYKVLLTELRPRIRAPSVFRFPEHDFYDANLVAVMMPFAGFDMTYEAIQEAAAEVGMKCERADTIWNNAAIMQDIVDLIDGSSVVICDCTNRNPNVFYELGIAHSIGKEVILITQNASDVPFDLAHLRNIRYLNNGEGLRQLTIDLAARLNTIRRNRGY
jgi:hypothetical protein